MQTQLKDMARELHKDSGRPYLNFISDVQSFRQGVIHKCDEFEGKISTLDQIVDNM